MSETIILGSGKVYCALYSGTMPSKQTLMVDGNLLGHVKGGAALTYTPTYTEEKDDLGYVVKSKLSEEVAIFKTGLITFDGDTLNKLCDTGTVTTESNVRTLKIGGMGAATNSSYVIGFLYEDDTDGDKWVLINGRNQAGFELTFAKDAATVVNAEFKCLPQDSAGTLIMFCEEIPVTPTP